MTQVRGDSHLEHMGTVGKEIPGMSGCILKISLVHLADGFGCEVQENKRDSGRH